MARFNKDHPSTRIREIHNSRCASCSPVLPPDSWPFLPFLMQYPGEVEGAPESKNKIKSFVDAYGINMDDFDPSNIEEYPTFEDFFTRRHKKGSRPIYEPKSPYSAVVVADSRVVTYATFPEAHKLWIKGHNFSIEHLIMDRQLARTFTDGSVASFRLSPQDYHRYHSPVGGVVKRYRSMPGDYFQVDPVALHSGVDILTRNRRDYLIIKSEEFGYVLFVAIGSTEVGSVKYVLGVL